MGWYGLGFVGRTEAGNPKRVVMASADMAICSTLDMSVVDYHGQSYARPKRDAEQSFSNMGYTVNSTDPEITKPGEQDIRTWWFSRPRVAQTEDDEEIAKGNTVLLWAVGYNDAGSGDMLKHVQNYGKGSVELEFCKPDPTTTTTTTSQTSSTTTTTTGTFTTTTSLTTTTSTTTTTAEEEPDREPLGSRPLDLNGFLDLPKHDAGHFDEYNGKPKPHYDHEQGVRAAYFDYSENPDALLMDLDAMSATRRNTHHGTTPDHVRIVPAINFPSHEKHNLGSPLKEHFATQFTGYLEVPEEGEYDFAVQCSDTCEIRMSCGQGATCDSDSFRNTRLNDYKTARVNIQNDAKFEHDVGHSSTRRGYGKDTMFTYTLAKGKYPFLVVHIVSKVYPEKEFLEQRLGQSMVWSWKQPGRAGFRPIPARYFSHKAQVLRQYRSDETANLRFLDGNLATGDSVRNDIKAAATMYDEGAAPSFILDLGYNYNVTRVMFADYKVRDFPITATLSQEPFGLFPGGDTYNCTSDERMAKGGPPVSNPPAYWSSRIFFKANCSGGTGRYLKIQGPLDKEFTVYGIFVNGVPVSPSSQTGVLRWSPRPKDHPDTHVQMVSADYLGNHPGYYRVYGALDFPGTPGTSPGRGGTEYRSSEFDYYAPFRVLRERSFSDSTAWLMGDYSPGSFVVDLGMEVDVAALRLLNSHGGAAFNAGVRDLRIEAGHPGADPENVALKSGVSAMTTSDVALGKACVSETNNQMMGKPSIKSYTELPTIAECHNLCQQNPLCVMYTWRYYGSCSLHAEGYTTAPDYNGVMGYRSCNAAPQDPRAAVDGDPDTCFTIPRAHETNAYWRLDLGQVFDIADIAIDSGETDIDVEVHAAETMEDVSHDGTTVSMHSWYSKATRKARCGGGPGRFIGRYGKHGESYSKSPSFSPSYREVPVNCIKRARYVSIKTRSTQSRTNSLTLCEVKVYHRPGASWSTVTNMTLLPTVRYHNQMGSSRGLGPWVLEKLSVPVKTRYLRVSADVRYKRRTSLVAFEVLSNKPVPRFEIRNLGAARLPAPGLRAELYHTRSGGLFDPYSRVNYRKNFDWAVANTQVGARATVPTVDFSRWRGDRGRGIDADAFKVRQVGTVHIGSSATSSVNVHVTFEIPFDTVPNVAVKAHPKLVGDEASVLSTDEQAGFAAEFTMLADNVTRAGFTLRVERKSNTVGVVGWDLVDEFNAMPLAATFEAAAYFPEYTSRFGTKDAAYTLNPSVDKTTKGWAYHFMARFTGELVADISATYTLHLSGTPFVRLLVDGEEVAYSSNLFNTGPSTRSFTVPVNAQSTVLGPNTGYDAFTDFGGDTTCSILPNGTQPHTAFTRLIDYETVCSHYVNKLIKPRIWTELAWLNADEQLGLSEVERGHWTTLGITEQHWNSKDWTNWKDFSMAIFGSMPVSTAGWDALSAPQKTAAKALGYNHLSWGRTFTFRERFSNANYVGGWVGGWAGIKWEASEMTAGEMEALQVLGWSAGLWATQGANPVSRRKAWSELSPGEQRAAIALGFAARTWVHSATPRTEVVKTCAYDVASLQYGVLQIPVVEAQLGVDAETKAQIASKWPRPTLEAARFRNICGKVNPGVATASTTLKLVAGKPVSIEIQTTNGCRGGLHAVQLFWSRPGIGKHIVPASALQHRARDSCLAFQGANNRAVLSECDKASPYQQWRFDGKFVRPGGQGSGYTSTLSNGDLSKKCLFSDNSPYNEYTKFQQSPFCRGGDIACKFSLVDCDTGGIGSVRVNTDNLKYDTRNRRYTTTNLWDVNVGAGTIKSLSRRAYRAGGQTACPEKFRNNPAKVGNDYNELAGWAPTGSRKYTEIGEAILCEAAAEQAPFMCLEGEVSMSGVRNELQHGLPVNLGRCNSSVLPGSWSPQVWKISPAATNARSGISKVFDNKYERWDQSYSYVSTAGKLAGLSWPHAVTCTEDACPFCERGTANNTCTTACNGKCEEPGRESSYGSDACAAGSDGYDCNQQHPIRECARICTSRDDCAGFSTSEYEYRSSRIHCYFKNNFGYVSALLPQALEPVEYYTTYKKINSKPTGNETRSNPLQSCKDFEPGVCPTSRCHRVTAAELRRDTRALRDGSIVADGLEDQECADSNTWPTPGGPFFSCAQYEEISRQEIDSYNKKESEALCNTPYVASICAVTCKHSEHCPATEYVCTDKPASTAAGGATAAASKPPVDNNADANCGGRGTFISPTSFNLLNFLSRPLFLFPISFFDYVACFLTGSGYSALL